LLPRVIGWFCGYWGDEEEQGHNDTQHRLYTKPHFSTPMGGSPAPQSKYSGLFSPWSNRITNNFTYLFERAAGSAKTRRFTHSVPTAPCAAMTAPTLGRYATAAEK